MRRDPKTRIFTGKRFKLSSPKMFKSEANKVKINLKKHYSVKIVPSKGTPSIHGQRFRTYVRHKK